MKRALPLARDRRGFLLIALLAIATAGFSGSAFTARAQSEAEQETAPQLDQTCPPVAAAPFIRRKSIAITGDSFGEGTMELHPGALILRLYGTPYQMGFQHGAMLRTEIEEIVKKEKADYKSQKSGTRLFFEQASALIRLYLEWPAWARQELKGIADGSEIPLPDLIWHNLQIHDFKNASGQGWAIIVFHGQDRQKIAALTRPGLVPIAAGMNADGCCLTAIENGDPRFRLRVREKLESGQCGKQGAGGGQCGFEIMGPQGGVRVLLEGKQGLVCISRDQGKSFGALDLHTETWRRPCGPCGSYQEK